MPVNYPLWPADYGANSSSSTSTAGERAVHQGAEGVAVEVVAERTTRMRWWWCTGGTDKIHGIMAERSSSTIWTKYCRKSGIIIIVDR